MRTMWKSFIAMGALVALVGCETNRQTQPEAERETEQLGENIEQGTRDVGQDIERGARDVEQETRQAGEDMQQQAGMEQEGITYEVVKIDKEKREVMLSTAKVGELGAPEAGEKEMQAGKELTLSFDELAKHTKGEKKAEEIAEELHEGENVKVFMKNGSIDRITY